MSSVRREGKEAKGQHCGGSRTLNQTLAQKAREGARTERKQRAGGLPDRLSGAVPRRLKMNESTNRRKERGEGGREEDEGREQI